MDIKKVLQDYISYHWIEDYITDEQKDAMLKNLGVYIKGMQPQLIIHSVVKPLKDKEAMSFNEFTEVCKYDKFGKGFKRGKAIYTESEIKQRYNYYVKSL